ncbi:MAG: ion transporter, partial [Cytophagales bacterium]|nr:ion transporter [Cytophagales bacterium]
MNIKYSVKKQLVRVEVYIYYLIFLNLIAFALESVKEFEVYNPYFDIFERASLIIFTMEYAVRVYIALIQNRFKKYTLSFMGLIDLLSIVPLFLPTGHGLDLRFTKLLRFFQIFRIMKLYRYSSHLKTIIKVVE